MVFNVVYGEDQPLTLGIVISANLKNSAEVMLQLEYELGRTCLYHVWDFFYLSGLANSLSSHSQF